MDLDVTTGFEPGRQRSSRRDRYRRRRGAPRAYGDGVPVVDLWWYGSARRAMGGRHPRGLLSLTKGLTALGVQVLVDRGQDVDAPVSADWPKFAAGGKEGALVGTGSPTRPACSASAASRSFPGWTAPAGTRPTRSPRGWPRRALLGARHAPRLSRPDLRLAAWSGSDDERGIDTGIGRVPDIEQRTPLELLACHVVAAARELASRR